MKLEQILEANTPTIDFQKHQKVGTGMPPIDTTRLAIGKQFGSSRYGKVPVDGHASLSIVYKDIIGAVSSVLEGEDGREWEIRQMQGAKSSKSLRVTASLQWQKILAKGWKELSEDERAEVERLTMPAPIDITNITDATHPEKAMESYSIAIGALHMRYSDDLKKFVADVRRAAHPILLSAEALSLERA